MGRSPDRRRNTVLVLIGLCCGMVPVLCDADYDPLSVSGDGQTRVIDLDVRDDARRRDIPVRCYLPNHDQSAPIFLFSHGLGGSREGCTYLGKHWSARGYAVISVFPNLPETVDKYEVVFHDAEHSAFSDRGLLGDRQPPNPNHHRAILALSTAFWDAYLRDRSEARAWLQGAEARGILEPPDRWQLHTHDEPSVPRQ